MHKLVQILGVKQNFQTNCDFWNASQNSHFLSYLSRVSKIRVTKSFYELFMSGKLRILLTAAILAVNLVEADWSDPMDRAQLLLNGTKFSNDLILWQNNEGLNKCFEKII